MGGIVDWKGGTGESEEFWSNSPEIMWPNGVYVPSATVSGEFLTANGK